MLPMLQNGMVELLDVPELIFQIKSLDRKANPSGRDTVDNFHGHDDCANSCAGALVMARQEAEKEDGPSWTVTVNTPESELAEDRLKQARHVPHPVWSTTKEREERKRMGLEAQAERKRKGIVLEQPKELTPEERKAKAEQEVRDQQKREEEESWALTSDW